MPATKTAALLRGQRYVWLRHQQLPPEARAESNVVRRLPVPAGTSLTAIRGVLNCLVRRHEGLRTTYHFDHDGDPWQVVHPPAPLSVPTVSVERDGTPGPAEVVAELIGTAFVLAKEWPLRACIVTAAGAPTQLVLVLNHMALDAWSVELLEQELEALRTGVTSGRPTVLRPVRHQPLDLARQEASAAGRGERESAAAYWTAVVAGLPTDPLARRRRAEPAPEESVAHAAALTSPALLAAGRQVAERYGVWPSLVHLATHARALHAYAGCDRLAHLLFVGTREASSCPDVLTCSFAPVLLDVDLSDDPGFGELLTRLGERFRAATVHSGLPYDELLELMAVEGARRGQPLRVTSELNFLNHGRTDSRARRTVFTRGRAPLSWAAQGSDTLLRIYEQRDAVVVALSAQAAVMNAVDVGRLLRGYETLLLAQLDPTADLRAAEVAEVFGFATAAPIAGPQPPAPRPARSERHGATEATEVLALVVGQVHGGRRVDPAQDYVTAGGRALRGPRVLGLLSEHGWGGLVLDDLLSGRPLTAVARQARWIG